jgi:pimeloyl-ACP methyl ester carboxylesterase
MRDSKYLGNLGGLSARHRLILLDLRGTGASAIPEDTASYRCDRLVGDADRFVATTAAFLAGDPVGGRG